MIRTVTVIIFSLTTIIRNPIKICIIITLASVIILNQAYLKIGKRWWPTLIFILFIGGIILMFMIVSATTPNETIKPATKKIKITKIIYILLLNMCFGHELTIRMPIGQLNLSKTLAVGNLSLPIMLFFLVLYFSIFISLLKQNKNSMRSL